MADEKNPAGESSGPGLQKDIPDGLWKNCEKCKRIIYCSDLEENHGVCPECAFHHTFNAWQWADLLFDNGSYDRFGEDLYALDILEFVDSKPYPERLKEAREKTGLNDAILCGQGTLAGYPLTAAIMEFRFTGGSMGSVVGELVATAAERAIERQTALLTVMCSGGARMQEGMVSLMQMAKTAAAIGRFRRHRLPYLVLLTHPSTAGSLASYGMTGDVILAEPGAMIGFAGRRVIEQTIKETLPDNFQSAEFQLEHGMVDRVVDRRELRETLAQLLRFFLPTGTD